MTATISSNVAAVMMIMYEDESVDVRYEDGSRVLLSPCGSEFVLVKAPDPAMHPLYTSEKVRQRTRFAISTYKDLMVDILAFRNKYALWPYLPEELTAVARIKPFFSIDSYVEWPESSSCGAAELGACGETVIRSVDGRASVMLSSSGEEFSVEFMCSLSQAPNQQYHHGSLALSGGEPDGTSVGQHHHHHQQSNPQTTNNDESKQNQVKGKRNKEEVHRSGSPQNSTHRTAQPKPEKMYHSTAVVQHCSCTHIAPMWRYPVSLARHHRAIRRSKPPGDVDSSQTCRTMNTTVESCEEERKSCLPEALPLICTSPHQHRWKFNDLFLSDGEHSELPSELIKVIWCQGVIYRILSGSTPVIEVSPGDGSVIRSNGALNSYFTHHRTEPHSVEVKEVTHHLNSLPPDVPGQVYSVDSIVSLASRILTCYNQASVSLTLPAAPSCLEQNRRSSQPVSFEQAVCSGAALHHGILVPQMEQSRSNLVDTELEKIKRFNFLLENSNLPGTPKSSHERIGSAMEAEASSEPVDDDCIAAALQRTSRAIQDIDTLLSATTLF